MQSPGDWDVQLLPLTEETISGVSKALEFTSNASPPTQQFQTLSGTIPQLPEEIVEQILLYYCEISTDAAATTLLLSKRLNHLCKKHSDCALTAILYIRNAKTDLHDLCRDWWQGTFDATRVRYILFNDLTTLNADTTATREDAILNHSAREWDFVNPQDGISFLKAPPADPSPEAVSASQDGGLSVAYLWCFLLQTCRNLQGVHIWSSDFQVTGLLQFHTRSPSRHSLLPPRSCPLYEWSLALSLDHRNLVKHSACDITLSAHKVHWYMPDLDELASLPHGCFGDWHSLRLTRPLHGVELLASASFWQALILRPLEKRILSVWAPSLLSGLSPSSLRHPRIPEQPWTQLLVIVELTDEVSAPSLRKMAVAVERCWAYLRASYSTQLHPPAKEASEAACASALPEFRVIFIHPSLNNDSDHLRDDGWTTYEPEWPQRRKSWSAEAAVRQCVRAANGRPSWWSASDRVQCEPEVSDRVQNVLEWNIATSPF